MVFDRRHLSNDVQVRKCLMREIRDLFCHSAGTDRNDENFRLISAGSLKQGELTRVSVVHLGAEVFCLPDPSGSLSIMVGVIPMATSIRATIAPKSP